ALLVLGTHPQWTAYAITFVAAWTLGPALARAGFLGGEGTRSAGRTARSVARWLALGLAVGLIATLLTVVQLLPTWEASGQSSRWAGSVKTTENLRGLHILFGLVGPVAVYEVDDSWEVRGLLGVFWLTAAVAAPAVAGRRAFWPAGVFALLVLFSVGGEYLP